MKKDKAPSEWGFKDVLKNPGFWDAANEAMRDIDSAVEAAKSWDDEEVAALTWRFILEIKSSRNAQKEQKILQALGPKTHSTVLALLSDANLYARLVKPTGRNLVPEAPFNRACDLLGDTPPGIAVDILAPFLNDPAEEIRQDAAIAIGKTGAPTITPHIRRALSDSEENVRSYALMGLQYALNRSGLAPSPAKELFPDVLNLLRENENADLAADVLYRLDHAKAMEFFLSPIIFSPDCPILHEVLEALRKAKVPMDRDRLLQLIRSLEAGDMKYPQDYALGEALQLLGQHKQEQDREFLHARVRHVEQRVAEGAAAGLLYSYDLEGCKEKLWNIQNECEYEALSEPQRLFSAVYICDGEINNGGLSQYFVNSSGNHWREALAGFEAMALKERTEILKQAIALFGGSGPSSDENVRINQLSKLCEKDEKIFNALDSRYYKSSEVLDAFATDYILSHPDAFR